MKRANNAAYANPDTGRKMLIRNAVKAQRQINIAYVREYLRDHHCVDCHESDPIVLEFDHVRGVKVGNLSALVNAGRTLTVIQDEINKCDVRCANCHRRVTAQRHGGWWKMVEHEQNPQNETVLGEAETGPPEQ